jgi:hypothetical protein
MKLEVPFLQLPLTFDAAALAAEIEALGESAWRPHPQGFPGNSGLPLLSFDGDPDSDSVRGPMRPTPQLAALPYLRQVLSRLGAVWGRTRLMRLSGQAEVTPHVDLSYYWREHMRVHVPIVTQPTVRFLCGEAELNMAAGECWVFDTWRRHQVFNDDHRPRIHLVADTVGGHGFWPLLRQARPHDRKVAGWQAQHVAPDAGAPDALELESYNVPTVMSPWELREHLGFLFAETPPSDALRALAQGVMGPFSREWHALWAKHGDGGGGFDEYRALRDLLRPHLARFEALLMRNGVGLVEAMRVMIIGNLVAGSVGGDVETRDAPRGAVPSAGARAPATAVEFRDPIIVLSTPRSGSTLLFETLAQAPGLVTTGHESHATIESIAALHPGAHQYESNRLLASDATPAVVAQLKANFAKDLRDRDGKPPAPGARVRLLEKTPKNALRLPFLDAVFPDARYVYLHREPRPVLASMIEAWQAGKWRTYPNLPGWTGLPWSLLLVPGWREWKDRPLEEIVARQWAATTNTLLDDLEALPPGRVVKVRYEDLVAAPQPTIERLAGQLDLAWDRVLGDLPLSRHTHTPPDPDKWRRHAEAIERVYPLVEAAQARAERFLAG